MAQQHDVQRQNASATDGILRAASAYENADRHVAWLCEFLQGKGDAVSSGLLVSVDVVSEQEGDLVRGTWLTRARRFWEFEAMVPRSADGPAVVERFEDKTDAVQVSAHVPGTGKSFGYLALEVLDDHFGSR